MSKKHVSKKSSPVKAKITAAVTNADTDNTTAQLIELNNRQSIGRVGRTAAPHSSDTGTAEPGSDIVVEKELLTVVIEVGSHTSINVSTDEDHFSQIMRGLSCLY